MKRVWLKDSLIYCIFPILSINFMRGNYQNITWITLIVGFLYTFYVRNREDRVNYSFVSFLVLFNSYFLISDNVSSGMMMQFNFSFAIFIALFMVVLEMMDISVCKVILQDILIMFGESKMGTIKLLKRSKVSITLRKLTMIIIMEILCCDLLALYYINVKGVADLSVLVSYEILAVVIFTLVELYHMNLIREKIKGKSSKSTKNIFMKEKIDIKSKVINLEHYR